MVKIFCATCNKKKMSRHPKTKYCSIKCRKIAERLRLKHHILFPEREYPIPRMAHPKARV